MISTENKTLTLCRWLNIWGSDVSCAVYRYGIKAVKQALRIKWVVLDDMDVLQTTAKYFIEYARRFR